MILVRNRMENRMGFMAAFSIVAPLMCMAFLLKK